MMWVNLLKIIKNIFIGFLCGVTLKSNFTHYILNPVKSLYYLKGILGKLLDFYYSVKQKVKNVFPLIPSQLQLMSHQLQNIETFLKLFPLYYKF